MKTFDEFLTEAKAKKYYIVTPGGEVVDGPFEVKEPGLKVLKSDYDDKHKLVKGYVNPKTGNLEE